MDSNQQGKKDNMKNLSDYYYKYVPGGLYTGIVSTCLSHAKTDGVKKLRVTKEEYGVICDYVMGFMKDISFNWDGKNIFGIELVVKEHTPQEILEKRVEILEKLVADLNKKLDEKHNKK